MNSPFSRRSASVGAPLGIRLNGESIVLQTDRDEDVSVVAIVDIEDAPSTTDGAVEVTGTFRILTTEVAGILTDHGLPMIATIRGETWDVYDQSCDQAGMTIFSIRRAAGASSHTNLYDLEGNQAVWHDEE